VQPSPGAGGALTPMARAVAATDELVAAALELKPLYDRLSALLGQIAGLLLLSGSRRDLESERLHLISLHAQCAEAEAAFGDLSPAARALAAGEAAARALAMLAEMLEAIDRNLDAARGPMPANVLAQLQSARRLLLMAAAPRLGIKLIDLSAGCCAGSQ